MSTVRHGSGPNFENFQHSDEDEQTTMIRNKVTEGSHPYLTILTVSNAY